MIIIKTKTKAWIIAVWIILGIILILAAIDCKPRSCPECPEIPEQGEPRR